MAPQSYCPAERMVVSDISFDYFFPCHHKPFLLFAVTLCRAGRKLFPCDFAIKYFEYAYTYFNNFEYTHRNK